MRLIIEPYGHDTLLQRLAGEAVTKTLRTMLEDPKVYKKQALGLGAPSWPMNSVAESVFVDSPAFLGTL